MDEQNSTQAADNVVQGLQKDFTIVGTSRVHSWYAWAIVGIVFGMALGIIYVANHSRNFSTSNAATVIPVRVYGPTVKQYTPAPTTVSVKLTSNDNTDPKNNPKIAAGRAFAFVMSSEQPITPTSYFIGSDTYYGPDQTVGGRITLTVPKFTPDGRYISPDFNIAGIGFATNNAIWIVPAPSGDAIINTDSQPTYDLTKTITQKFAFFKLDWNGSEIAQDNSTNAIVCPPITIPLGAQRGTNCVPFAADGSYPNKGGMPFGLGFLKFPGTPSQGNGTFRVVDGAITYFTGTLPTPKKGPAPQIITANFKAQYRQASGNMIQNKITMDVEFQPNVLSFNGVIPAPIVTPTLPTIQLPRGNGLQSIHSAVFHNVPFPPGKPGATRNVFKDLTLPPQSVSGTWLFTIRAKEYGKERERGYTVSKMTFTPDSGGVPTDVPVPNPNEALQMTGSE